MKVKMLSTQRGTLNNGCGNISMDYLSGQVYNACPEEAAYWIEQGLAEAVIEAPIIGPSETKAIVVVDSHFTSPETPLAKLESMASLSHKGRKKARK
jgi:hypothetical protein